MRILFVCTSNKDRSPALEKHFKQRYPMHEYRSAGINEYHTKRKGTTMINYEMFLWADKLVFAESVHRNYVLGSYLNSFTGPDELSHVLNKSLVLAIGDYDKSNMQQYVLDAEKKILETFPDFQDNLIQQP